MIINATTYQQNVGEYFKLADQGEEIIIEKQRPKGYAYKLVAVGENKPKITNTKELEDIIKEFNFSSLGMNALEYQKLVRQ